MGRVTYKVVKRTHCDACDGSGKVIKPVYLEYAALQLQGKHPDFDAYVKEHGYEFYQPCSQCNGVGYSEEDADLEQVLVSFFNRAAR